MALAFGSMEEIKKGHENILLKHIRRGNLRLSTEGVALRCGYLNQRHTSKSQRPSYVSLPSCDIALESKARIPTKSICWLW